MRRFEGEIFQLVLHEGALLILVDNDAVVAFLLVRHSEQLAAHRMLAGHEKMPRIARVGLGEGKGGGVGGDEGGGLQEGGWGRRRAPLGQ